MQKRETLSIVVIIVGIMGFIIAIAWVKTSSDTDIIEIPTAEHNQQSIPDFAAITNLDEKKRAFFNYLIPEIEKQNEYLLTLRHYLQALQRQGVNGQALKGSDIERIDWLKSEYRIKDKNDTSQSISALLIKIDILPKELVLVQAANESAWGTSRFARDGYNFFGLWCYRKGCGFVPTGRTQGASHEVAKFDNLTQATYTYMRNINRNRAYNELREIRAALRQNQMPVTGLALSEGLISYSERGAAYVEELQAMIRFNSKYF